MVLFYPQTATKKPILNRVKKLVGTKTFVITLCYKNHCDIHQPVMVQIISTTQKFHKYPDSYWWNTAKILNWQLKNCLNSDDVCLRTDNYLELFLIISSLQYTLSFYIIISGLCCKSHTTLNHFHLFSYNLKEIFFQKNINHLPEVKKNISIIYYFRKTLHFRFLQMFCICLWCTTKRWKKI